MRCTLFDFQEKAALALLEQMQNMQEVWHTKGNLSSCYLSAATGAGKTVISAAVFESLFFGYGDHAPDSRAVVLWLSDNPSLNSQTLKRIQAMSDRLHEIPDSLVEIDPDYAKSHEKLEPCKIYFLNRQKITSAATLGKSVEGSRTFWQVIANTIEDHSLNFYLFIDEAHKGLGKDKTTKTTSEDINKTVYSKFIDGQVGINPPAPVVIGITATPQNWIDAMTSRNGSRDMVKAVNVSNKDVRESGIIKELIELRSPEVSSSVAEQDLIMASRKLLEFETHWTAYNNKFGEKRVVPLMVVQVQDNVMDNELVRLCMIIKSVVPMLDTQTSFANVFGEGSVRGNDVFQIHYVSPDEVQDRTEIRVLFAKDAVSTGWDCPRAEVLYSQRPRFNPTYIHQMLGRMVRTPLAHRISSDDFLNRVVCYLPTYDSQTVEDIVKLIRDDNSFVSNVKNGDTQVSWFGDTKEVAMNVLHFEENKDILEKKQFLIDAENILSQDDLKDNSSECLGTEKESYDSLESIAKLDSEATHMKDDFSFEQTPDESSSFDNHSNLFSVSNNISVASQQPEDKDVKHYVRRVAPRVVNMPAGVKVKHSPMFNPSDTPAPVLIDVQQVQKTVNNMPVTKSSDDVKSLKESFEGIISTYVEKNDLSPLYKLMRVLNFLTTLPVANTAKTWEDDAHYKSEFLKQVNRAIEDRPQEFQKALDDILYRRQYVAEIDPLTGEKKQVLVEDKIKVEQIKLFNIANSLYYKKCTNLVHNEDYVQYYVDYMTSHTQFTDESMVVNRLLAALTCSETFGLLQKWATDLCDELIRKHDVEKGRMSLDNQKIWEDILDESCKHRERHLVIPTGSSVVSSKLTPYKKHLISDAHGLAYFNFNDLEKDVLNHEINGDWTVAWYRNNPRSSNSNFSIVYEISEDNEGQFYPDFLFFERTQDDRIIRTIVDPHGEWLADSVNKLKGYVNYLKKYPDMFQKVLAVTDVSSIDKYQKYRYLDMCHPKVQEAVLNFTGSRAADLFLDNNLAVDYVV